MSSLIFVNDRIVMICSRTLQSVVCFSLIMPKNPNDCDVITHYVIPIAHQLLCLCVYCFIILGGGSDFLLTLRQTVFVHDDFAQN